MEAWKHVRAILLLPGMVLGLIPGTLLWLGGFDTLGLWRTFPAPRMLLLILGILCVCLGLTLMIATIRLFVIDVICRADGRCQSASRSPRRYSAFSAGDSGCSAEPSEPVPH